MASCSSASHGRHSNIGPCVHQAPLGDKNDTSDHVLLAGCLHQFEVLGVSKQLVSEYHRSLRESHFTSAISSCVLQISLCSPSISAVRTDISGSASELCTSFQILWRLSSQAVILRKRRWDLLASRKPWHTGHTTKLVTLWPLVCPDAIPEVSFVQCSVYWYSADLRFSGNAELAGVIVAVGMSAAVWFQLVAIYRTFPGVILPYHADGRTQHPGAHI